MDNLHFKLLYSSLYTILQKSFLYADLVSKNIIENHFQGAENTFF